MAYEQVTGPLGLERFDILHADMMAMLYNPWAKKGKEKKPKDFMPDWDQNKKQTPMDMLSMLKNWTAFAGGQIRKKEES